MIVHIKDKRSGNMLCEYTCSGLSFCHSDDINDVTCKKCLSAHMQEKIDEMLPQTFMEATRTFFCKRGIHLHKSHAPYYVKYSGIGQGKLLFTTKECSHCGMVEKHYASKHNGKPLKWKETIRKGLYEQAITHKRH